MNAPLCKIRLRVIDSSNSDINRPISIAPPPEESEFTCVPVLFVVESVLVSGSWVCVGLLTGS